MPHGIKWSKDSESPGSSFEPASFAEELSCYGYSFLVDSYQTLFLAVQTVLYFGENDAIRYGNQGNQEKITGDKAFGVTDYAGLNNLSAADAIQAKKALEDLSTLLFYLIRNGEIIGHETRKNINIYFLAIKKTRYHNSLSHSPH